MNKIVQEIDVKESPNHTTGRLNGQVRLVSELTIDDKTRMFSLFSQYYHASRTQFDLDLVEKVGCALVRDRFSDEIQGFSTYLQLEIEVDGEQMIGIYSGDTIINKEYWGETELFRVWSKHIYDQSKKKPYVSVYWFLLSSGYKTYRFLPLFFREFYPTYKCTTPISTKRKLDALAKCKFPSEYNEQSGIVRLNGVTPLRDGVADVTTKRLKDPHVAYFIQANPGYRQGDNLACIAKIDDANLTSAAHRILGR